MFEDSDENKFEYTTLFEQYTALVGAPALRLALPPRVPDGRLRQSRKLRRA